MNKEEAKIEIKRREKIIESKLRVIDDYNDSIKIQNEKIADLQAIINKPDRWQDSLVQPDKEEYIYLISNQYEVLTVGWGFENERKPEHAFRTKEQAELIKEKILLMQEMQAFAHVRNEGWMPDWQDEGQKRYGIALEGDKIQLFRLTYVNSFVFGVTVKSREIAEEMLEIFGERIEKFYNKMY